MTFIIGEIRAFAMDTGHSINGPAGPVPGLNALPYYAKVIKPAGFLHCDGSSLLRKDYPDLFEAIGETWGSEDYGLTFRLPDLRGKFLRAWSDATSHDPDRDAREFSFTPKSPKNFGGASGNRVGSAQPQEIQLHAHGYVEVMRQGAGGGDHPRTQLTVEPRPRREVAAARRDR